jgi:flagellar hook protein FlgE
MLSGIFNSSVMGMQKSIEKYNSIVSKGQETDLIRDMTEMLKIKSEFKADTKVIKTVDEMLGAIIDLMA